jgi:Mn2+/Fe2+ NRAMP family transporter
VKKIVSLLLGVVTSIGGFVEAGSISTAAQAGAEFGYALLWTIAAATVIAAVLSEMSGRVAIVSKRSIAAAVRERFGIHLQLIPFVAELMIDLLLLSAEIGGAAIAIKLLTGIAFPWWVLPVGAIVWLVLWFGSFGVIEDSVGLLGLVTLAFVVAAWKLGPDAGTLAAGFVPTVPNHDIVRYGFLAVSIIGATVSPYLLNFYASGTIEEKLAESDLWINRTTALFGMGFGSVVSMGVLVTSAIVLAPLHMKVESYEQAALMFVPVFDHWAVPLFALALGIGCLGAAIEITLNAGYLFAQSFGWAWGVGKKRRDAARFTVAYTIVLMLALALAVSGIDPLQVTLISVGLTVVIMPAVVLPFLVLLNDERYVKDHTSGAIGNGILGFLVLLSAILAAIVIPLEIWGG